MAIAPPRFSFIFYCSRCPSTKFFLNSVLPETGDKNDKNSGNDIYSCAASSTISERMRTADLSDIITRLFSIQGKPEPQIALAYQYKLFFRKSVNQLKCIKPHSKSTIIVGELLREIELEEWKSMATLPDSSCIQLSSYAFVDEVISRTRSFCLDEQHNQSKVIEG